MGNKSTGRDDCYGSASTLEGKTVKIDCSLLNGVVCIQISGDVKSSEEAKQDLYLNMDDIPRDRDIQQAQLISEFYVDSQQFDDLVLSSMMKKRKKRRAPYNGRRILTGAHRSKIQTIRTKTGKQPLQSRTFNGRIGNTRRVTSTRNNIVTVQEDQGAPADQKPLDVQVPAVGESPAQKTPDREKKPILGENRGLFKGGQKQEVPDNSRTSKKRGKQGREMCMPGWSSIAGSCIQYFDISLTWEEAKATCEGFSYKESKATLITLEEEGMRTRVLALLDRIAARTGKAIGSFWTSGTNLQEAGTDADPLAADRNCVAHMGTDGLQPELCSQRYSYVCQLKAPIISEDDLVR
ncbi:hypothetical protein HOLleu_24866 [Holothuria leucospilota]|uniref:C-type lectin domain-containing protein n=1 Tax=Holothuria leucospilota TaxID=206669 RepID=A0A9Q1H3J7_HOLLE|nr:hypothetical protein HOLleu_24866 [Holothuria leucospilota]